MLGKGAVFDKTGAYRYRLWRVWNESAPRVGFIMLNPSTADDTLDDPTIRRCIGFARAWGYGAVEVVNLFAYRATRSADLRGMADPIGRENDRYLQRLEQNVQQIIVAWGNLGAWQNRDQAVIRRFSQRHLHCLGTTLSGSPRHPLYLRKETLPQRFEAS